MNKLWAALEVLQKGKELSNKEVWKNLQLLTNLLASVLAGVAVLAGVEVSSDQINSITLGFVTVVGIVNAYFTVGTSSSVGMPTDTKQDANTEQPLP